MADPQWLHPEISRELGDIPITPAMPSRLADFLDYLYDDGDRWPERLILPDSIRAEFGELYQLTEQHAAEHGYALLYDRHTHKFDRGATIKGDRFATNPFKMPRIDDPNCFGYVHAHPSSSIGHKGGYCAHSIQDLLLFENFAERSRFFEFVVSGPKVYAMIYTQVASPWNNAVKTYLEKQLGERQGKELLLLFEAAGSEEAWKAAADSVEDNAGLEQLRLKVLAQKPDIGRQLEKISIESCRSFAKKFNYCFIICANQ